MTLIHLPNSQFGSLSGTHIGDIAKPGSQQAAASTCLPCAGKLEQRSGACVLSRIDQYVCLRDLCITFLSRFVGWRSCLSESLSWTSAFTTTESCKWQVARMGKRK